jgi:ABC-2 type transport system permease protein
MSALLRAELLKLRTTRTFAALVGAATVVSLLIVTLAATKGSVARPDDIRSNLNAANPSGLLTLLLGAIGMTGEWRHRTITSTVLATPARVRLLAAKTLSYTLAGMLLSLLVTLAIMLVGTLLLSARGAPTLGAADLADLLWRNLLVAALFGALGVCLGAIVCNQIATLIGIILMFFFLEPLLLQLAPDVGRFTPFSGAPNGILGGVDFPNGELLAPGIAVLVSIAWISATFAAGAALLRRRDLV